MNITFLSYYSGKVNRGVETYVLELAKRLGKSNQVCVIQSGSHICSDKYKTVVFKSSLSKFNLRLFSLIPPDTQILIPTNGRLQSLVSKYWIQTHRGTKLVIPGQSGPGLDDRFNLACFPDRFIALTGYQKLWAQKTNPLVKTEVIPNGVDLTRFHPGVKPLNIDLPRPVILYVAALEPIKRHHLLIPAVSGTSASLLMVGQGSLYDQLNAQARSLLPGRFKIISVPFEKMPSVYPACDLFVYPTSPYESFGISILEAMASGLPVVSTDDPIRKDIVGAAGWYAHVEDTADFSEVLSSALSSTPGQNPVTRAQRFSWKNISSAYQQLCDSLII